MNLPTKLPLPIRAIVGFVKALPMIQAVGIVTVTGTAVYGTYKGIQSAVNYFREDRDVHDPDHKSGDKAKS